MSTQHQLWDVSTEELIELMKEPDFIENRIDEMRTIGFKMHSMVEADAISQSDLENLANELIETVEFMALGYSHSKRVA